VTKTNSRTNAGELTVLLPSWRLHLEASNLSPRTIRAYTDDGALLAAFLARQGMPTAAASIRREHVEAFIVAELARTAPSSAATRYRSLQQLFKWLDDEGEISGSPMAKMRPPIIPEQAVPVLSDDQIRCLLAACSGKGFRDRRDIAIIRLFLDTGMRLEGMGGLRYRASDADLSDVDLKSRVAGYPSCTPTSSDTRSRMTTKWAELHLVHHSALRVNARYLRRSVRCCGAPACRERRAATMTWDFMVPLDLMQR
jgi:site-specific recombinase XerC